MSRTQIEITLSIFLVLATSFIILFYGVNEQNRMSAYASQEQGRSIEVGASLFETYCSRCHAQQGTGIPGLCPPLNDRYFFDNRLKEVGWSGSQEDYIIATASGGRIASTRPNLFHGAGTPAMPAFSDRYGGPLRDDQIRDIAAFIMNWSSTATNVLSATTTAAGPAIGTDITQTLPKGDPQAGSDVANKVGCAACHITTNTGPAWSASGGQPGIAVRAETRFKQPDYHGKATTPEQYLLESIVSPSAYVVPGFQDIMPKTFSQSLTAQDVANLIAYLETFK